MRIILALGLLLATVAGAQPPLFSCDFAASPTACGFIEQSKVPGRATSVVRAGRTGVQLHTEPGDNNVVGSATMERDDFYLADASGAPVLYGQGVEQWWTNSIYLPDDFTLPAWHSYVIFDFHNFPNVGVAASFHIDFVNGNGDPTKFGQLQLQGFYGDPFAPIEYKGYVGVPQKNIWYDFVLHVRWSDGPDGFFDGWANGVKVLTHRGPTLYPGATVYLKIANYHLPVCDPFPSCIGTHAPSSVIHGPIALLSQIATPAAPRMNPPAP